MTRQPLKQHRRPITHNEDDVVLDLVEEQVELTKQRIVDGHVSVTRSTSEYDEVVSTLLNKEKVDVEHVAKGQYVDVMPATREENGVLIIPVVEEEIEIVRKLVLKEELHIRKVQENVPFEDVVTIRKQHVTVKNEDDR